MWVCARSEQLSSSKNVFNNANEVSGKWQAILAAVNFKQSRLKATL